MLFDQSERGHGVRTGCTSRGVGTMFDQSERGYSVCTSRGVSTLFDQSEPGYSVRHRVYVRFSTNQSTAIAYVTGCTYAVWPIRARWSRILISAAPCGGLRRPAVPLRRPAVPLRRPAVPLRRPKKGARKPPTILLTYFIYVCHI